MLGTNSFVFSHEKTKTHTRQQVSSGNYRITDVHREIDIGKKKQKRFFFFGGRREGDGGKKKRYLLQFYIGVVFRGKMII